MWLFVYEAICAGALGEHAPESLRQEGWAMLAALVEDFEQVAGVKTLTLLDHSCPRALGRACRRISPGEEPAGFADVAARADWILLIAPESDGCLAERWRWAGTAGKPLLGPTLSAIELTADKWALANHFTKHGIPTPATQLLDRARGAMPCLPQFSKVVCKPRHGAGSQITYLLQSNNQLALLWASGRARLPNDDFLVQEYVLGQAASVSCLMGPRDCISLAPAAQTLSDDGRFRYLGGWLPLPDALAHRAEQLARRALATIPGLSGVIGVDMVLGTADDGSQDWVIEVNPRPTTSYIGLRRLAQDNLAEVLCRVARGERVEPIRWGQEPITFSATQKEE